MCLGLCCAASSYSVGAWQRSQTKHGFTPPPVLSFPSLVLSSFLQATSTVRWTRSPWRWSPSARVSLPSSMQHRTRALSPSRSPSTCRSILLQMVSWTPWEMSKESIFPHLVFFSFFFLCLFLLFLDSGNVTVTMSKGAVCFLYLFSPPNPVNSVYIDWQKGQQKKSKMPKRQILKLKPSNSLRCFQHLQPSFETFSPNSKNFSCFKQPKLFVIVASPVVFICFSLAWI